MVTDRARAVGWRLAHLARREAAEVDASTRRLLRALELERNHDDDDDDDDDDDGPPPRAYCGACTDEPCVVHGMRWAG